jgi:PadR family transcriptional regulator, regulatory protein PadR
MLAVGWRVQGKAGVLRLAAGQEGDPSSRTALLRMTANCRLAKDQTARRSGSFGGAGERLKTYHREHRERSEGTESLCRYFLEGYRQSTGFGVEHLHPVGGLVKKRYQNRIELLQGTLDMLILQTLQWGPRHGYGLSQSIRTNSGEILKVDTGSLYPALHRLERAKWIAAEWKVSENNQRTRVYKLTAKGKKQLISERSRWAQLSDAIAGVLNPAKVEGDA